MNIYIKATVVGKKPPKDWTDPEGRKHAIYKLNIIQNDGDTMTELRVPEEVYAQAVRGQEYTFNGTYNIGHNGGYLKVTNILE